MAALPPALNAVGVDARLIVPGFSALLDALPLTDVARLRTPFATERVRLSLARLPESGQPVYLVAHPASYDRPGGPYQAPDGGGGAANHRPFPLRGWAARGIAQS